MLIREPVPADAPALARVHVDAWQAGYAGLVPQGLLDETTVELRTASWERITSTERGAREKILVAEMGGSLAGFVHLGQCRDADSENAGELWALNVAPSRWGSGVATCLLQKVHCALWDAGYETGILWVLVGNARACKFYERHGWRPDGHSRDEIINGFTVSQLRYTIELVGSL